MSYSVNTRVEKDISRSRTARRIGVALLLGSAAWLLPNVAGATVMDTSASQNAQTATGVPDKPIRVAQVSDKPPANDTKKATDQSQKSELETVVVTGEKTTRSLFNTASSVHVFDTQDLQRRGLTSVREALDQVPNLVTTDGGNSEAPAVRGVDGTGPANGANAFFAGERPRLNYVVDGRTLSYNEAIYTDPTMWDVNDVEVFLGPQSTLQGRNSIGGAIVINTKNPTYDFEGDARFMLGSFGLWQGSAAFSGPIVDDQVAFRVSMDEGVSHSYIKFTPYSGVSDPGRYRHLTLRAKLLFEPKGLSGFSTLLTVSHFESIMPQNDGLLPPFTDDHPSTPKQNDFSIVTTTGTANSTWEINDTFTLKNVFSATGYHIFRSGVAGTGIATINGTEFTEEPRLVMAWSDLGLSGFLGANFFQSSQNEAIDLFGGGLFKDYDQTWAIFGEYTYSPTSDLDITLGGRAEQEHHKRMGLDGPFITDLDKTYGAYLPKANVTWHVNPDTNAGIIVSRGYDAGGAGFTFNPPFTSYVYGPEYVWNYEGFVRTALLDDMLSLSANVFLNNYKDMQLPFNLSNNPSLQSVIIGNVPRVNIEGADIGARYQLTPEFELTADLGLLETKIHNTALSGIDGNQLGRAPRSSLNLGAFYNGDSGFEVSFNARYSDGYFTDQTDLVAGRVSSFWIENGQIAYRFKGVLDGARLFVSVDNLTNSGHPVSIFPGTTPAATVHDLVTPRIVKGGVEFSF